MLNTSNLISLFVLGPLLFYPFVFCPFRLPYLYCFVCPTRCGWGQARGIILLAVLVLNIKRESFCKKFCPLGNVQTLLFKLKLPKLSLPKFVRSFKYIILVLIVMALLSTTAPLDKIFYIFIVILFSALAASIFIYRPFCYNLCPIKALREISKKLKKCF